MEQEAPAPPPSLIKDRYRPVRVLGEGSFARTLACEDGAAGNRLVAVKELRVQGLDHWKPVELFEREARVLMRLRHPGVPEILEHFEARSPDGKLALYLVMELIDGPSLRERLEQGPAIDQVELIDLTLRLFEVLDYLHGQVPAVFHRDIKPANIVLRPSGAPVLVDFGGVRDGCGPTQGGSTVTGTFGYMPPEQLLGQVSPASDLYALGATLLHALTGREPTDFSLDSGRLSVPADLAVRPALRHTIDALLAPAPRDRPGSARAARRLLLEEVSGGSHEQQLMLMPARSATLMATPAVGGPILVEMGLPPRDPKGELTDVYLNLLDCYDGRHGKSKRGSWETIGYTSLAAVMAVCTAGIIFLLPWLSNRRRERQYGPLFREGLSVPGKLVNLHGDALASVASLTYEYEVAGRRFRASMEVTKALMGHLASGDPVTVLHDGIDPSKSCVVYRWQR